MDLLDAVLKRSGGGCFVVNVMKFGKIMFPWLVVSPPS